MTRKAYQGIAEAIATAQEIAEAGEFPFTAEMMANEIIHQIGSVMLRDNDRFDRYRFGVACRTPRP